MVAIFVTVVIKH